MYLHNEEVFPEATGVGVSRKVLAFSDNLMTVELTLKKGAIGARHTHVHEQVSYIICGKILFQEEGQEDQVLAAGDSYHVAPNVEHGIVALEDTKMIDVFTPMRQEFLDGRKLNRKPDEKTAAICGLFCGNCPCYPDECHGCLSDKLTEQCTICPNGFRSCTREHGVVRCHECTEFPCSRLEEFSKQHWVNGICHHAQVIDSLYAMRKKGEKLWVEEQIKEHTCPKCQRLIPWFEKECPFCE